MPKMSKAPALPHQTRKRIWIPWQFAVVATTTSHQLVRGALRCLQRYCIPASLITVFLKPQDLEPYTKDVPRSLYGRLCPSQHEGLGGLLTTVYSSYKEGTPLVICRDSLEGLLEYDKCAPQKHKPVKHLIPLLETLFQTCQKEHCMLWGLYPVANGLYFQPTLSKTLKQISGGMWGCFNPGANLGNIQFNTILETEVVLKTWKYFHSMIRWNGLGAVWAEPSHQAKQAEYHSLAETYPTLVRLRESKDYVNLELLPV